MENKFYVFDNNEVGSLVFSFNRLGKDLVGAEIGAGTGQCSCCFLQKCENIKTLYLIDPYKPYVDMLQERFLDEKQQEYNRFCVTHNLKWSGFQEKAVLLEMDDISAADRIPDQSLDFAFIDVWLEAEQILPRLDVWSSKVKPGGILCGHDWNFLPIQESLQIYRENKTILAVNNVWMWYKD
jgi:predicted O-methyltransferase YrrM